VIISHKYRFIFFAVPRTATHAVRHALRPYLGEEDWEQQMLAGEQSIPVPEIAAIKHGHISYRQLRKNLPADILGTYFKFAFVRNPFDRFVSTCFFLNRRNPQFKGREIAFMRQAIHNKAFLQRVLVMPQYNLLINEDMQLMMDYVGRYETLQGSFNEICRHIGIPAATLSVQNRSDHRNPAEYYDRKLMQSIADLYRPDFKLFGYNPQKLQAEHETDKAVHPSSFRV